MKKYGVALAGALVHHRAAVRSRTSSSSWPRFAVGRGEVDDVLAVVRAGLQHLDGLYRGEDLDVGQRQAGVLAGRCGERVQLVLGGVPVLDQGVDVPIQRQDPSPTSRPARALLSPALLEPDEGIL